MVTSNQQKLRELYPTTKSFEAGLAECKNQKEFAAKLGMHHTTLYNHVAWLKGGRKPPMERKAKCEEPDGRTMDETIKAIAEAEGRKNTVTVYRIVGEYIPCQRGYEGMELVERRVGKTWSEVGKMVNPKSENRKSICFW